jgi:phosphopantothenoylcysteine decarboxylase/phosphopantothenate--cysteine ligase
MKIILGVCGSISAYKTVDLARSLILKGNEVKVVLTKGSEQFLNKEVFKFLKIEAYSHDDDFKHAGVLHIDLARWADTVAICPLSANTLSKLANGACDDLLSSVFLSLRKDVVRIVSPAMNVEMLNNEIVQANLKKIKSFTIQSDEGLLACGEVGSGKLPNIQELAELIPCFSNKKVDKTVVITAGATLSNIDTVRFVTNPARGGSAYLLAKKYLSEGYRVEVIKGHYSIPEFNYLKKHPNYKEQTVVTTKDLMEAVKAKKGDWDIYISPMAVSDLEFESADKKLKKNDMNGVLTFKQAQDVLRFVVENKKEKQVVVGFAAESTLEDTVINEKLARKPVDLLVANLANSGLSSNAAQGFGTDSGDYRIVTKNKKSFYYEDLKKKDLADIIFKEVKKLL